MSETRLVLFYGFIIFAMFFGSGNLVLPLQIGYLSGDSWMAGFLGMLLTGIILPFMGLLVIKLNKGDYKIFFADTGFIAKILPLFMLSLMGPFGVAARCITVAHGGVQYLMPNFSLLAFSGVFSIITYAFCLKESLMFKILGKWLSPIKMLTLFFLIFIGINNASTDLPDTDVVFAFTTGINIAYQTMDLFAAFFFSAMIFHSIQQRMPNKEEKYLVSFSIKAGIVGFSILAIIYMGLVYLSSHYVADLEGVAPKAMLPTIAMKLIGKGATVFIAITMFFSCLATAITLNNLYSNYICEITRLNKKYFPIILFITVGTSFSVSLLDFSGISAFLVPILEVTYPGLIALTISSLIVKRNSKVKTMLFWTITLAMIVNTMSHYF